MRTRVVIVAAALSLAVPAVVSAQTAGLETVERLLRAGRADEARQALLTWWDEEAAGADRQDTQRALWLRGRLTVDPREAQLDYQRLTVEYPGGPFSDDALLRLAQAAHATGDGSAVARYVGQLRRDYPSSPVVAEAQRWLESAGEPLTRVRPEAVTGRPEPARREGIVSSTPPQPERPPVSTGGRFAVQLGAFAGAGRAQALRDRLMERGVEARLVRVRDTQLIHVRAGRFDSAEAALDLLTSIELLGFNGTVVRDADGEEVIGS